MATKDQDEGKTRRGKVPDYEKALEAFHTGFHDELRAVVQSLPLSPGMAVADIGCGDGFYTELLAERLDASGSLTAIDSNSAYLKQVARRTAKALVKVRCQRADLDKLKTFRKHFDLVWCAQSFFSFPNPKTALRQLTATLKPGGLLVVLENDSLHQCLLPWPSDMELAIRLAEFQALKTESDHPQKFYVGRRLPLLFEEAGLKTLQFRTQAIDRRAPQSKAVQIFVNEYLKGLYERITPYVQPEFLRSVKSTISDLRKSPQFSLSWINYMIVGERK